jgi:zinc protease
MRTEMRASPMMPVALALLTSLALSCAGPSAQGPDPAPVGAAAASGATPATLEAPPTTPVPEAPLPDLPFPDEPFRATQPVAGDPRPLKAPELARFTMPPGLSVYLVERHNLPIVGLSVVFEGGSRTDPKGKDGLASTCADLLTDGTEKLDRIALAEVQADLASSITSGSSDEQHWVSLNSLKKNLGPTLDLWADSLLRPGLRKEEFDRNIKRRIAGLTQMKGTPTAVAGRLSGSVVYGPQHTLGRFATEASYSAFTVDDCKKFAADYLKPQGAKLFVVGDITREELTKELAPRLAGWKGRGKAVPTIGRPRPRQGRVFFVDVPGAPQSVVQVMHLGPPRKAPDYHPTSIMSAILGGGFTSRINMNIREKHGYAYGAGGGFAYNRQGSAFRVSASVRADVTKESIQEILKEVRGILKDAAPTDAELVREKDGKILALPAQFATGNSTLSAFQDLIFYDLPLNYFDSFVPKVKAVDLAAVKKAASRYLKPGQLQLLVVGDAKTVLPKLKEIADSDEFGKAKIQQLDPDGNPVTEG